MTRATVMVQPDSLLSDQLELYQKQDQQLQPQLQISEEEEEEEEEDGTHLVLTQKESESFQLELLREDFDDDSSEYSSDQNQVRLATPSMAKRPAPPQLIATNAVTSNGNGVASRKSNSTHPVVSANADKTRSRTITNPLLHIQTADSIADIKRLSFSPAVSDHSSYTGKLEHVRIDSSEGDHMEHYSMGLKHREKLIDDLKKENFGMKMRVYFLTETIQKLSPEGVKEIIIEHAELKAIVEDMRLEAQIRDQQLQQLHQLHDHQLDDDQQLKLEQQLQSLGKQLEIDQLSLQTQRQQLEMDQLGIQSQRQQLDLDQKWLHEQIQSQRLKMEEDTLLIQSQRRKMEEETLLIQSHMEQLEKDQRRVSLQKLQFENDQKLQWKQLESQKLQFENDQKLQWKQLESQKLQLENDQTIAKADVALMEKMLKEGQISPADRKELVEAIDQLELMVSKKTAEVDVTAVQLQEARQHIVQLETEQVNSRAERDQHVCELNQKLSDALQKVKLVNNIQSRHPSGVSLRNPPMDPTQLDIKHITEKAEFQSQMILYKQKIDEFQAVSVCNAEDMVFLQRELERQTSKLKALEEKSREKTERSKVKTPNGKPEPSYDELSNETLRLIPQAHREFSESDFRNLVIQLYQKLQDAGPTEKEAAYFTQMIRQLMQSLPALDTHDANRLRYIAELKQRNLLLVQVNQRLDSVLSDSALKPQHISSFSDLKLAIHEKLELLKSHYESTQALQIEKRLWKTKMSAMEARLIRVGAYPDQLEHATANVDKASADSGNSPTETEALRKQLGELQARLGSARQEIRRDRQGAKYRIEELVSTNRKLESDLLQCSRSLVALKENAVALPKAVSTGSPGRAKLARLNEQLRTDLGDQISEGAAMRDQLRKTKIQCSRAISEQQKLGELLERTKTGVSAALHKLALLKDDTVADPAIVKQIYGQTLQILHTLAFK
ncbi:hypothetical protein BASA60_008249 [Batrachochytrium salamandrivorans]|nr:hypothetical protein BASA60_008249 [Batrachochytrium salamandrivorans]